MEYYVGLDVSLKEISICVVDRDGMDLHRFCSGQVLMLGGPLFEGHW